MISLIGFPDFIMNDTTLDDYYDQLEFEPLDNYAEMVRKSSVWAQHKAFRRLREEVDRMEFGTSSAVVNAFYSSVKNGISKRMPFVYAETAISFSIPRRDSPGAVLRPHLPEGSELRRNWSSHRTRDHTRI